MKVNAKVAIVILNWNGWKDTIECLESLSVLERQDFAVVVVDNASTDFSRDKLLNWTAIAVGGLHLSAVVDELSIAEAKGPLRAAEWTYVQSTQNGGFAAGNNLGIRLALQAGCQFVWLLNNDTVVDSASLVALERRMSTDATIGMCGSILRYHDDRELVQAVGGARFSFVRARAGELGHGLRVGDAALELIASSMPTYVAGASLFVSAEFLHDVGLMEESYFLYYEEIDWAVRAAPRWTIATARDSIVYHKEGASIGSSSRAKRSAFSQYYMNRNLVRFYMLRRPWLVPFAVRRVLLELLRLIVKREHELSRATYQALLDGVLMRSGPRNFGFSRLRTGKGEMATE